MPPAPPPSSQADSPLPASTRWGIPRPVHPAFGLLALVGLILPKCSSSLLQAARFRAHESPIVNNAPASAKPRSASLADEQSVAVRILDTDFAFGHIFWMGNGRDADTGRDQVISQCNQVGRVEIEQDGLLAGNNRLARTREHQVRMLAGNMRPLQFAAAGP